MNEKSHAQTNQFTTLILQVLPFFYKTKGKESTLRYTCSNFNGYSTFYFCHSFGVKINIFI